MIIYSETKAQFLQDVHRNQLEPKLAQSFRQQTGWVPTDRRVWADEYARFSGVLHEAEVDADVQVAIEYHVSTAGRSRIDVLLTGSDGHRDHALVLELKAWSEAEASDVPDLVKGPYGGGSLTQHPCVQARKYKGLILRFNADIAERDIGIESAAYLFNLKRRHPEPLEHHCYRHILQDTRLFLAEDAEALAHHIRKHVRHRATEDVLFLLEKGRMIPSPALIERVESMLDGNEEFDLIDSQNEAFQIIRHAIASVATADKRQVFIVHGGPGTGKSVIAIRLLAEALKSKRLGFFVAPNKAFRDTIAEQLTRKCHRYAEDGRALFQSSWSFHRHDFMKDRLHEVLIVDEAHRLKDKAYQYQGKGMMDDIVRAARISVFFLDEHQRVHWDDTGSEERIRQAADKHNAQVHEPIRLTAQFRCAGSDGYLNWLDDVLQIRPTGNFDNWADGQYEFRVFDDASELYKALTAKNCDNKARLIAGYAWDWPTAGRQRQKHIKHVQADSLELPWNFDGENWATAKDGIQQVGCVHTSQGIEFDWLGVLIGSDLRYERDQVVGDPSSRAKTDKSLNGWKSALRQAKGDADATASVLAKVHSIIKNTYKVLLSRGRKGCFVWCADKGLRDYLRDRLKIATKTLEVPPEPHTSFALQHSLPTIMPLPHGTAYIDCLPIYDLRAAATAFGESVSAECLGWMATPAGVRADKRHFIAQVFGRSMEPQIPDGSFCVFRIGVAGSRKGKTLLVQHSSINDPEAGGSYTVKRYHSLTVTDPDTGDDASWQHETIRLDPLNKDFRPIWINPDQAHELRVVAELVKVIH